MPGLNLCAALCLVSLSLFTLGVSYSQRYPLYTGGTGRLNGQESQPGAGLRATSRYRNWCAYVVTRVVSCVIEDGVATYVRPEYQPCGWGQMQCSRTVMYRSFMKPRYKIAYKMVSEMEWRCCHGYSGDDCSVSLPGLVEEESSRSDNKQPEEDGKNSDKSHQMEEKIQSLTQQVHKLQNTIETMTEKFQEEMQRVIERAVNGEQPADAASHTDMKDTINEIQNKLQQIDNRVREHDIEIDILNTIGASGTAGSPSEVSHKLSDLKEELVREVELRIQHSCFSCRADIELLRQQQGMFRQRLQDLGRIFNRTEQHNRLLIEGMHKHLTRLTTSVDDSCCRETESIQSKVEDVEGKLVSLSEVVTGLEQRLHRKSPSPDFSSGTSLWDDQLQNLERKLNLTEMNLEKHIVTQLENLRNEFGDRIHENEERINTVVSVLGNSTVFDDWLRETIRGIGEDVTTLKKNVRSDGHSLESVVSQLHQLESRVQGAISGCAQHCNSSLLTQDGQDTAQMLELLTKLQIKIAGNELSIQDTGKRVHNLTIGGHSLRNRLQQFGEEVKQLESMTHSNKDQMRFVNSGLRDLEDKLQYSAETSLTICNTIKDEVLQSGEETKRQVEHLTEELEKIRQRFSRLENDCRHSCSQVQTEFNKFKVELGDPNKQYEDLLLKIENFNNTLKRLGMFGGNLGIDLGSINGELRDVILTYNSVNNTLRALQDIVHQQGHNTDKLNMTFHSNANKLKTDISRIQEKIFDHIEDTGNKLVIFQNELGKVRSQIVEEGSECKNSGERLEERMSRMEQVCNKLDSVSQSLEKIKEGLNRHVSSLWNCQRDFNATLQRHSEELKNIKNTHLTNLKQKISLLNHSVSEIHTEIHNFTVQEFTGAEGPHGPPGPPGPQGIPGLPVYIERVSFSAALTTPQHRPGTILFDKVLVNEGNHYDPGTGIFSAPFDGRYFISAILTGHRNQRIEAVLAKSNTGLARIDSGGFQPEGLENRPVIGPQPTSGSLGIFNIILPLSQGDTVCIDLVTGKLAHSDEPLTIFNGVLLYKDKDI
ncbi:EMILIN-1-A-like [Hypanus sabinus]|uniref:EMILIN-1-A-like n=1 Tax=Hypanus sabinus TaxID=79690 RepID=UPI0028C4D91F|nr:EMILIN-1-A-like [Hypanus sabinus]